MIIDRLCIMVNMVDDETAADVRTIIDTVNAALAPLGFKIRAWGTVENFTRMVDDLNKFLDSRSIKEYENEIVSDLAGPVDPSDVLRESGTNTGTGTC